MANHPQITFESRRVDKINEQQYKIEGDLTIRGKTQREIVIVEYGGTIKDPWGNMRAGFAAEGKINRKEFGLHWNSLTETGGLVAGDEVKYNANVEFVKSA
jgi:polyisoprenoid-binding protein YceI